MKTLRKIWHQHKNLCILIAFYTLLRVILFNINFTEWGDSFRFIRGAEYLSQFSWPWDEKRWPFYSLTLVPGVWLKNPIFWGRITSLLTSLGIIVATYKFYLQHINRNKNRALAAALLTSVVPVMAYTNLRIMADNLFALLIILTFYFFLLNEPKIRIFRKPTFNIYFVSFFMILATMTRPEALFALFGISVYLFFYKKWKNLICIYVPQILIYLPWTLYTKFIYSGPVQQNDYFDEIKTFVFDLERFKYFAVYTLFLFLIPTTIIFIARGAKKLFDINKKSTPWIALYIFILLEFVIGFVWTPSLPRLYLAIIPFLAIFLVEGLFNFVKNNLKIFVVLSLILLSIFAILQAQLKLYFLGASKIAFGAILIGGILVPLAVTLKKHKLNIVYLIIITANIITSAMVIANQRNSYKSVKQALDFVNQVANHEEVVAYHDETGNSTWYLGKKGIRPDFEATFETDTQCEYLAENKVDYVLWTNEFNRGSYFIEPEEDTFFDDRYKLLAKYETYSVGVLGEILINLDIKNKEDYFRFETKVYKVLEGCKKISFQ